MAILTRAALEAQTHQYRDVHIAAWGGEVRIVQMSGEDVQLFQAFKQDLETDLIGRAAAIAVRVIVDADGKRLYTDDEAPHLMQIPGSGGALIQLLFEITDFSGVSNDQIAELTKKSKTIPVNGSSTGSRSPQAAATSSTRSVSAAK